MWMAWILTGNEVWKQAVELNFLLWGKRNASSLFCILRWCLEVNVSTSSHPIFIKKFSMHCTGCSNSTVKFRMYKFVFRIRTFIIMEMLSPLKNKLSIQNKQPSLNEKFTRYSRRFLESFHKLIFLFFIYGSVMKKFLRILFVCHNSSSSSNNQVNRSGNMPISWRLEDKNWNIPKCLSHSHRSL